MFGGKSAVHTKLIGADPVLLVGGADAFVVLGSRLWLGNLYFPPLLVSTLAVTVMVAGALAAVITFSLAVLFTTLSRALSGQVVR